MEGNTSIKSQLVDKPRNPGTIPGQSLENASCLGQESWRMKGPRIFRIFDPNSSPKYVRDGETITQILRVFEGGGGGIGGRGKSAHFLFFGGNAMTIMKMQFSLSRYVVVIAQLQNIGGFQRRVLVRGANLDLESCVHQLQ